MIYKSKELVEEEQKIVEDALNSLVEFGAQITDDEKSEFTNKILRQKIRELEMKRKEEGHTP